jgi:predicted NAD/FAD-binding protein
MRIAIIGTGIAGNVVAHRLHRAHEISVFEANDYVGGHTNTVNVEVAGEQYAVDTGFIVFNDWTYPNFIRLLEELQVPSQPTSMSFSVRCKRTGLEYNGTSLNTLFAQRRNLLRPEFYRMVRDILRFNRTAPALLDEDNETVTLGDHLHRHRYSEAFIDYYIIPMGAAIWSTDPERMFAFPARYFVRFLNNHGMLSVNERPQWRVVTGGSAQYVNALTHPFRKRIRLDSAVKELRRYASHVEVTPHASPPERFDYAFLACHSDQALRLLVDATPLEHDVLSAIPYQVNEAVLHTDSSVLPKRRRAWAAWNYHVLPEERERVAVTYNMNILQGIDAPVPFCVTLNHADAIDPSKIIRRIRYDHPLYTRAGVAAQLRQHELNGAQRTFFCGAYWRYGFHEDGVVSAMAALQHFEQRSRLEQLSLRRAG